MWAIILCSGSVSLLLLGIIYVVIVGWFCLFNSRFLIDIRTKALRHRVLYSALDGLERGILYLAGRVVDGVRSGILASQLDEIVTKLCEAMKNGFTRHMESFGVKQASKIVKTAIMLGSTVAQQWLTDTGFKRYLVFIDINKPTGYSI